MIAMTKSLAVNTAVLSVLLALGVARAEPLRTVESARIRLADVVATKDPELAEIDLGPSPPPGSSRLFGRSEIVSMLKARGVTRAVAMPPVVRVQSAGRRFTADELESLIEPHARGSLPAGVVLKELRVARAVLTSPRAEIGEVRMPRLPRRAGELTITASADLLHEANVVARVPVTLVLELDRQAAAPLVQKGARLDLVIARGAARISAAGVALDDADLDEVRSFRVSSTGKVLRARVESATRAVVVTP
jgi:hypothetical protein